MSIIIGKLFANKVLEFVTDRARCLGQRLAESCQAPPLFLTPLSSRGTNLGTVRGFSLSVTNFHRIGKAEAVAGHSVKANEGGGKKGFARPLTGARDREGELHGSGSAQTLMPRTGRSQLAITEY